MKLPEIKFDPAYKFPPPPRWKAQNHTFKNKAKPGPKRLIWSIDNGTSTYSELVAISHARYACRCGADVLVKRHFPAADHPVVWEKFTISPLLRAGYQVLVIDNDALITDACPDLFYLFNGPHIYAVDERIIHKDGVHPDVEAGLKHACHRMGLQYTGEGPYVNAGVILANPKMHALFRWPDVSKLQDLWLQEQDYLNAILRQKPDLWRPLPAEANVLNPKAGQVPWIVHPAGRTAEDKYKLLAQFA